MKSPCPPPPVILLCVSVSSLAVWRPPASPLPQELYWGLLRHGNKQVSEEEGQERGGVGDEQRTPQRSGCRPFLSCPPTPRPTSLNLTTAGQHIEQPPLLGTWLLSHPQVGRQCRVMGKHMGFRLQRLSFESPTRLSRFWLCGLWQGTPPL